MLFVLQCCCGQYFTVKKKIAWSPMLPYKYLIEHMKTVNDYPGLDSNSTLCVIVVLCSNDPYLFQTNNSVEIKERVYFELVENSPRAICHWEK